MHINLERNSQILDFYKLKWFLPCLFTLLLRDWKDNKGKETPCELVGTHVYGWTDFLDQHWKWLLILIYFTWNIYKDKRSHIGKEVLSHKKPYLYLEWNAMKNVCELVRLEYMQIFPAGRSTSRSGCEGRGGYSGRMSLWYVCKKKAHKKAYTWWVKCDLAWYKPGLF